MRPPASCSATSPPSTRAQASSSTTAESSTASTRQDSWKATRRLTLNYGLRYEPAFPWHEKFHRIGTFDPVALAAGRVSTVYPNAPAGLLFPGDAGVPDGWLRWLLQGLHASPRLRLGRLRRRSHRRPRRQRHLLRYPSGRRNQQRLLQRSALRHLAQPQPTSQETTRASDRNFSIPSPVPRIQPPIPSRPSSLRLLQLPSGQLLDHALSQRLIPGAHHLRLEHRRRAAALGGARGPHSLRRLAWQPQLHVHRHQPHLQQGHQCRYGVSIR